MYKYNRISIILLLLLCVLLSGCNSKETTKRRIDTIDNEFTTVEVEVLNGIKQLFPDVKDPQSDTKIVLNYLNNDTCTQDFKKMGDLLQDYRTEMDRLKIREPKIKLQYDLMQKNYNDLIYLRDINKKFDSLNEFEKIDIFDMVLAYKNIGS